LSIEFRDVFKRARGKGAQGYFFRDLNFRIELGMRIGILGLPRSGKSTLLRMICGSDHPDGGTIERNLSTSWPIPLNTFLLNHSSVASNIRFVAQLYGDGSVRKIREVAELVDITDSLNVTLSKCTPVVKRRLTFGMGVGFGFDVYLFDERVAAVDKDFQKRAMEIFKSLVPGHATVIATAASKGMADQCDTLYVLQDGTLTLWPDIKQGIRYFESLTAKTPKPEADFDSEKAELAEDTEMEVGF
jgi:capsular polysaccharide transport system ATP-binding protein